MLFYTNNTNYFFIFGLGLFGFFCFVFLQYYGPKPKKKTTFIFPTLGKFVRHSSIIETKVTDQIWDAAGEVHTCLTHVTVH